MYPFINIFDKNVSVYGIMMLIGFFSAFLLAYIRAKRFGVTPDDIVYIYLLAVCGGITGAFLLRPIIKLPEILMHWGNYSSMRVKDFLSYWFGELIFYGGIVGGLLSGLWYCRKFKLKASFAADIIAPAIPLGHAFGRIGCLFAGCCYGIEVTQETLLSIEYPQIENPITDVPTGVPLLAIPIIEAMSNIFICIILLLFDKYKKTPGITLAVYGAIYASVRFIIEFYRGDIARGTYGLLSTSQIISIVIFIVSIVFIIMNVLQYNKRQLLTYAWTRNMN